MSKIFIDPGHGGHDPGAVGKNSKEKDNVLKVGLRLKALLESAGHTVKMSRSTDVYIGLSERAQMANNWGANYFVSLHDNSATDPSATGFETFIFNGPVSAATTKLQASIHKAITSKIGIRDRGMKRGNLAVLRESAMPAVLVEYAFISNAADESILINKVEQLAQWTAQGITAYAGGSVKPAAKPTTPKEEIPLAKDKNAQPPASLAKEVQRAKELGITDGTYPNRTATRAEVAAMIVRAVDMK